MTIQSFDIDGVILINDQIAGLRPYMNDVIITGRSYEETSETFDMLHDKGIGNKVYFNTVKFADKTRKTSGQHKGRTLLALQQLGFTISCHYEDDEIQAKEIKRYVSIPIILIQHSLSILENVRHK